MSNEQDETTEDDERFSWKGWAVVGLILAAILFTLAPPVQNTASPPEGADAAETTTTAQPAAPATTAAPAPTTAPPKATTTTAKPAPTTTIHLAAVTPTKGMKASDIGIIHRGDLMMPDDCQDPKVTGLQNMVTYVNDHSDPHGLNYVTNALVPGYVCGFN